MKKFTTEAQRTQRRHRGVCALLVYLVCLFAVADVGAQGGEVERKARLRVFDYAWRTIAESYYDPMFGGVDWSGLRSELRPLAEAARTDAELYSVLRRLTRSLRDPHTRIHKPGEAPKLQTTRFVSAGLILREVEGTPIVVSVERTARGQGVRIGDALQTIDGREWREILARQLPEGAPSSAARARAISKLLDGEPGTHVEIELARAGATSRRVRLLRQIVQEEAQLEIKRLRPKLYSIKWRTFTPEVAAKLARALRGRLHNARALVIDLRDNNGGDLEATVDMLSIFLAPNTELGRFINRDGRITDEPRTRTVMISAAERIEAFRGEVVVLISARTASAGEVFAGAMQDARRATLLGETTCGCVLGVRRRHQMPDGGTLEISELDYRTPRQVRLEGTGVTPDEFIPITREDVRRRRDPVTARAISLLGPKSKV